MADNAEDELEGVVNRARKVHHAALTRGLVDVMREYNDVKLIFRRKCKDRIKRQFEIVGR